MSLSKAGLDLKTTQSDKKTVWHLAMDKNDLALLKKVQAFGADPGDCPVRKIGNTQDCFLFCPK